MTKEKIVSIGLVTISAVAAYAAGLIDRKIEKKTIAEEVAKEVAKRTK